MKKTVLTILSIMLCLSAFASEPFVTISTAAPLMLYSGSMESESMDLSSVYGYSAQPVIIPFIVRDSGLSFDDLISNNPFKVAQAVVDAIVLAGSFSDFYAINGSGSVTISPDMSTIEDGIFSFQIGYDDVSMIYQAGGYSEASSIDGTSAISIIWSDDSIFTLSVDADTTLSGKGDVSIDVFLDYDTLNAYLDSSGYSLSELRPYIIEMLSAEFAPELISMLVGVDISSVSTDELIAILEERNMLDILDALTFIIMASEDYRLSSTDPFTMCFTPVLSVDGHVRDDFDLDSLIKTFVKIYHFTEMF